MTIGFRILRRVRKVDAGAVAKFKALPLANVSDVMSRMSAGGPRLRPMHGKGALAGPALTVKTRPGDNLMVHKAFDLAEPGDVIVVDAGGDLTSAIIGELMVAHARKRGVAGCVIDGAIRDSAAIGAGDFPVFAAGVTHRGPYKDGPGEINVAIAIGGMVIEPGDLVLAKWRRSSAPPRPSRNPRCSRPRPSKPGSATAPGSTRRSSGWAASSPTPGVEMTRRFRVPVGGAALVLLASARACPLLRCRPASASNGPSRGKTPWLCCSVRSRSGRSLRPTASRFRRCANIPQSALACGRAARRGDRAAQSLRAPRPRSGPPTGSRIRCRTAAPI